MEKKIIRLKSMSFTTSQGLGKNDIWERTEFIIEQQPIAQESNYLVKLCTSTHIWLVSREVRKHFVIEKITWQLIFYNIISNYGTKVLWVESLWKNLKYQIMMSNNLKVLSDMRIDSNGFLNQILRGISKKLRL